jgi:hypothetical protein
MKIIQKIFEENWDAFVEEVGYENIREICHDEVDKIINCGKFENGYLEYTCGSCGEVKRVGFTCKSRLCSSCGKKYVDERSEKMSSKMLPVKHWHMTFTIPEDMRIIFRRDRELLGELPRLVNKVIKYGFTKMNKSEDYTPGIIAVIHTFGRDLKWNPHVHAIVTKGGIGKTRGFVKINFMPYPMLRKAWQKLLLDMIKKHYENNIRMTNLVNQLYKKYPNGFYVNANRDVKNKKEATKYIGRYVGRPAISEKRIVSYDGEYVVINYTDHKTKEYVEEKITVFEFIKRVIVHVAEKQFKMIRYYGIYTSRSKRKKVIMFFRDKYDQLKRKADCWRMRLIKTYGHDPIKCSNCGEIMNLTDIYYKKYGSVLEFWERRMLEEAKQAIATLEEKVKITNYVYGQNLNIYYE